MLENKYVPPALRGAASTQEQNNQGYREQSGINRNDSNPGNDSARGGAGTRGPANSRQVIFCFLLFIIIVMLKCNSDGATMLLTTAEVTEILMGSDSLAEEVVTTPLAHNRVEAEVILEGVTLAEAPAEMNLVFMEINDQILG